MQTFDMHLLRLYKSGVISLDEALRNSDSPNNLKLKINLSEGLGSATDVSADAEGKRLSDTLSLQAIHKEENEEEGH
jgi:twitching motility protein PilU